MDSKYVDVEPKYVAMNETHIVCASENRAFIWQYRGTYQADSGKGVTVGPLLKKDSKEKIILLDENEPKK